MKIENVLDTATSFIMDPSNDGRRPLTKGIAWAITIIMGFGTVGIVHGISALWRKSRHIEKNETHEKIARLFKKIFSHSEKTPPAEVKKISTSTQNSSIDSATTSIVDLSPLEKMANNVFEKRDALWDEAKKESVTLKQDVWIIFINKIRSEFRKDELSLSNISDDANALNVLFRSRRLRLALLKYAKDNNLNSLIDKHLVFLAQKIYDSRENLSNKASGLAKNGPFELLAILTLEIKEIFNGDARSIKEVFDNKEALAIFKKSERLKVVLYLYLKLKETSRQEPPRGKSSFLPENLQTEEALRLAKKDAEGPGLVTKLGLNEFESDEKLLHKQVKQILKLNHPDKNPNGGGNNELVQDATDLLNMLKRGDFGVYKNELKKHRNQKKKKM